MNHFNETDAMGGIDIIDKMEGSIHFDQACIFILKPYYIVTIFIFALRQYHQKNGQL